MMTVLFEARFKPRNSFFSVDFVMFYFEVLGPVSASVFDTTDTVRLRLDGDLTGDFFTPVDLLPAKFAGLFGIFSSPGALFFGIPVLEDCLGNNILGLDRRFCFFEVL